MAKRKRYSDDFRASAVLMLEAAGYPDHEGALSQVSRHLGVPLSTLSRWFKGTSNPPPSKIVNEKKADLAALIDKVLFGFAEELVRRSEQGELADEPLNHVTQGYGIAFDKKQLFSGQPTAILKLRRVIEAGLVTPEQARETWPTLAEQLFAEIGLDAIVSNEP